MQNEIERQVLQALAEKEEVIDDEISKLNNLEDLENIRNRRIEELKKKSKKKKELINKGHGIYNEIYDPKDFFNATKSHDKLVVHFYRPTTWRCEIVDRHLSTLAHKYFESKFMKINAERQDWLADRLQIRVLPSIVLIKNGQVIHTIVGFGEFGGKDDFDTILLENRLKEMSIIEDYN
eukprot:GHVL01012507.1.p1 GENE.GHVL01012507.1~~GHVL01012507.1.p1  ORF type:complete len:179 (-),score=56.91 GHVL01012507.1:50-586(-)